MQTGFVTSRINQNNFLWRCCIPLCVVPSASVHRHAQRRQSREDKCFVTDFKKYGVKMLAQFWWKRSESGHGSKMQVAKDSV